MPALDTNVLVRYLVRDDETQFALAQRLIAQCVATGQALFVPVTVVLELDWVLRSRYARTKPELLHILAHLFSAAELQFESERALEVALQLFREGAADFADGVHVAPAAQAGEQPLWTFDRRASLPGARLLAR